MIRKATATACCAPGLEQAIREIYLRPFEMCVKDADCHAVMSSFNFIGNRWAGGSSSLCQNVLRDEWGFKGLVESDYFGTYGYMTADEGVRGGTDLMLATYDSGTNRVTVIDNASTQALRKSVKNILYTVVNSRAYEENNYKKATALLSWQIILIVVDVIALAAIVGIEFLMIKNYRKKLLAAAEQKK